MTQPVTLIDVQFNAPGEQRERRLVESLRSTQQSLNEVLRELQEVKTRLAAAEAALP